jgi:calmodulin
MTNTFSEEQIAKFQETFDLFDKDGNGVLSLKELKTLIENLGEVVINYDLYNVFNEIDKDGDGNLNFDEFLTFMSLINTITVSDNDLMEAFQIFDKDGNGFISAAELRHVLVSKDDKITDIEIDQMIATVDIDGDGQINYEEFIKLFMH